MFNFTPIGLILYSSEMKTILTQTTGVTSAITANLDLYMAPLIVTKAQGYFYGQYASSNRSGSWSNNYLTWTINSVSWYLLTDSFQKDGQADAQNNRSGSTYYYIVFGS